MIKSCLNCEFCKIYDELYYCKLDAVEVEGYDYCENWKSKIKENKI